MIDPLDLAEDETGEVIFPSLLRVADHVTNPLGDYYLYFAPHDAPGDIKVAYADNIEGPYTEYAGNPLIDNQGQGKLGVVRCVACVQPERGVDGAIQQVFPLFPR